MKIVGAEVIVCCPSRNYVTLKLTTDDGLTGIGDATLNGRELAVASYLTDHLCPLLIGRPADRIEDTWQLLYKGAYWRRGPVTMTAIAAVDTALWDIKGKAAGLPLYQLLGGRAREGVMVYGHASGETIPEALEALARFLDSGYRAVRVQCGVPGVAGTYGVTREKLFYEPATSGVAQELRWSTEAYLRFVPELLSAVRARFGFDFHLLHDVHHRLTPIEAARLGKAVEEHALFWLEDPVHAGGITHLRKIFTLAELHDVRTGSHGATDLSPVCMAAALHLDLSVPNFGIQEYMVHSDETNEVFPHDYRFERGYLHPGEAPGLGVGIDEQLAARFPYRPASLPVARLLDGTVHSW
jgi:mannonate dehydratase